MALEGTVIPKKTDQAETKWTGAGADFSQDNDSLEILGLPVMERWETPFMHKIGCIAASKGGRVLEVGFGLAICASKIEEHDITEHVIIEGNSGVFARLQDWGKKQKHKVTPMKGMWKDVAPQLPDCSFDGIMYDTYTLAEDEIHTHVFDFIKQHAYRLLKPGGVLAYSNLLSWEKFITEGTYKDAKSLFEGAERPKLIDAGFKTENISFEVMNVVPPKECRYYTISEQIAPTCYK